MDDGSGTAPDETSIAAATALDVDRIGRDLDGVEVALARLDAGTYWTCETTGSPLPDSLLADDPTARRLPAG
jgi:RNA polymerase-binding transcription factor DksA